ncbi:NLRC5 [Branchiostoma lanceolatum]|uniref:NLRC5 protein n=1 Tax=Branchiostoma lanceolatum TaxID=7740 RepID=A0A8K0ADL7_BRALA|nr:NLRC5 [Branchiostoma lanceolatum]
MALSKPSSTDPVYTPGTDPVYTPGTDPVYTPGTDPVYTPGTDPVYTPGTDPVYTPGTDPVYTPGTDPVYTPGTDPVYTPGTDPVYTPGTDPVYTPGTDPVYTPGTDPVYTPDTDPVYTPGTDPVYTPGTDPVYTPGTDPVYTPGTDPVYTPGTDPVYTPGTDPVYTPGTDPVYTPGTDPVYTPGTDPVYTPGTDPVYTPGTDPVYTPGTDPVYTPGTDPVYTPGTARGARLAALLVDEGTSLVRKIFEEEVKKMNPPSLREQLKRHKRHLCGLRYLNPGQRKTLYPPDFDVPDTAQWFDISLLELLLKELVWLELGRDAPYADHRNSFRQFRNNNYGHISSTDLSEEKFDELWKKLTEILVALGGDRDKISERLSRSIDPEQEAEYFDLLEKLYKEDMEVKDLILAQGESLRKGQDQLLAQGVSLKSQGDSLKRGQGDLSAQGKRLEKELLAQGESHKKGQEEIMEELRNLPEKVRDAQSQGTDSRNNEDSSSRTGLADAADDVIACLKDLYATEHAHVRPLPWCEDLNLHLEEVYTNLRLQQRDGRGRFQDTGTDVSLADIYNTSKGEDSQGKVRSCVRKIRVEGDPGIGKSCSCQKLAYDWSRGKLDRFKVVFFLEMRHLAGKVKDAIFEQLLPKDTTLTPDQLWSYIRENQKDVLFILDGLDELSQTAREVTDVVDLIQGKILRNCHIMNFGNDRGIHTAATMALSKPRSTDPVYTPGTDPVYTPGTDPVYTPGTDPVYTPGTDPVYTPGTDPVYTPGTDPVYTPGTDPVYTPGTDPVYTPGTDPVYTPGTDPVYTPGTDPVSTPGTDPVYTPGTDPVYTPGTDPVYTPGTDPVYTPGTDPVYTPGTDPVYTPGTDPVYTPGTDPVYTPGTDPVYTPGTDPVYTPGTDPVYTPGTDPVYTPGTDPVYTPGTDPVYTPGTDPVYTPGTDPVYTPGTDPVYTPGTDPVYTPGTDPVYTPGTDPVYTPGTDPVYTPGTDPVYTPGTDPVYTPGTDPVYTPGTARGAKLAALLVDEGTALVRNILEEEVQKMNPPSLRQQLEKHKKYLTGLRHLNPGQRKTLYPPRGDVPDTAQGFDISLLELLLKELCGRAPYSGPRNKLRQFRNNNYGHISSTDLPEEDFDRLWEELTEILVALGGDKDKISERLNCSIDPEQEVKYFTLLEKLHKEDMEVKDILGDLKKGQGSLKERQDSLKEGQGCLMEGQDSLKEGQDNLKEGQDSLKEGQDRILEHLLSNQSPGASTKPRAESGCQTNQAHTGSTDAADDVIACLKDLYATEHAHVRPLPWCEDLNLHLGEIYTSLQLQRRDDKGHFQDTNTIVSLSDIYQAGEGEDSQGKVRSAVRKIRVEGDPGIGKSCSCQKLAYDWSCGKLDRFKVVFFLEMRHLAKKVKHAIFEQLLPEDTKMTPDLLWSYIQENQDDVLFILDGLDELSQTAREVTDVVKLIQGKILRNCHILVTSRPYHCVIDLEKCHQFYRILGYSKENSEEFINRYFCESPDSVSELVKQLQANKNLSELVVNPLNNVLICVVWEEKNEQLPSSKAELYEMIVLSIAKRFCTKMMLPVEGDILPPNIEEALRGLEKLSWVGLEQEQLQFNTNEIIGTHKSFSNLCLAVQKNRTLKSLVLEGMLVQDITKRKAKIVANLVGNKPSNYEELRITMVDCPPVEEFVLI